MRGRNIPAALELEADAVATKGDGGAGPIGRIEMAAGGAAEECGTDDAGDWDPTGAPTAA
jgi:hypothetical protein